MQVRAFEKYIPLTLQETRSIHDSMIPKIKFITYTRGDQKVCGKVLLKIVSEYDQEIPQSQTADNPVALCGRAA